MSGHPLDLTDDHDGLGSSGRHPHSRSSSSYHRHHTELPVSNLQSEDALDQFDKRYGTSASVAGDASIAEVPDSRREAGSAAAALGYYAAARHQRQQQLALLQLRVDHAQRQKEQRRALRHLEYELKMQASAEPRFPPVGTVALCGCGIATIALNYPNTGLFELNPTVSAMQIPFAGLTQLLVAVLEWMNGSTAMYSIFSTYAAFHLAIGLMLIMPFDVSYSDVQVGFYATRGYQPALAPVTEYLLGVYLLLFAIWTLVNLATVPLSTVASTGLLLSVFLTYFLQAVADMIEFPPLLHAGAYCAIIAGGGMLYAGLAETVNYVYGRELIPLIAWSSVPGCFNYRAMQRRREQVREQERRLAELQTQAEGRPADSAPDARGGEDHLPPSERKPPVLKRMLHLDSKADATYL